MKSFIASQNIHRINQYFGQNQAFVVGIDQYAHLTKLETAVNDAEKVARTLEKYQGFTVNSLFINPGRDQMSLLFEGMKNTIRPEDRVVFYFSGHGLALDSQERSEGFLIPADARPDAISDLISMAALRDLARAVSCQHFLIILDCCFSGSFRWSRSYRDIHFLPKIVYRQRFELYVKDKTCQVLTSCAHDQKTIDLELFSRELNPKRRDGTRNSLHSPFARALFKGLEGEADLVPASGPDGIVTVTELYMYLRHEVEYHSTGKDARNRQTPGLFRLDLFPSLSGMENGSQIATSPWEEHTSGCHAPASSGNRAEQSFNANLSSEIGQESLSKEPLWDKGEFIFINPRVPVCLEPAPEENPYKGLLTYNCNTKDALVFYGRDRAVSKMLAIIEKSPLLVVTGASGSGKSSLVNAGLIPELKGLGYRIVPVFRPGADPLDSLENALAPPNKESLKNCHKDSNHDRHADAEKKNSDFFDGFLFEKRPCFFEDREKITQKISETKCVLAVDQFEELVTRCKDEESKEKFISFLSVLLKSVFENKNQGKTSIPIIVLTVRSDFEPHFIESELKSYWTGARYTPSMPTYAEFLQIVENPARQYAYFFEKGLTEQIVTEISQAPGGLPLLSFCLGELFDLARYNDRGERKIKKRDYDGFGGVVGALKKKADDIYERLRTEFSEKSGKRPSPTTGGKDFDLAFRNLMLRMIGLDSEGLFAKRVLVDDLKFSDRQDDIISRIVDELIAARLLMMGTDSSGKKFIEPAHEALIHSWPKISRWIRQCKQENLILQARLSDAVKEEKDGVGRLWDGHQKLEQLAGELDSKTSWMTRDEKDFTKRSIHRKKKKIYGAIAITVVVVMALAGLTYLKSSEARRANANYYAALARLELESDPLNSIRYADKAYRLDSNDGVQRVLTRAAATAWKRPFPNAELPHGHHVNDAIFSRDGLSILTASSDKTVKIWSLRGNLLETLPHPYAVHSLRLSLAEDKLIAVGDGPEAVLWDLRNKTSINLSHHDTVLSATFSPDSEHIVTASEDNIARIWDSDGRPLHDLVHPEPVTKALFFPDGKRILTCSADKNLRFWDVTGNLMKVLNDVDDTEFSPDGERILVLSYPNTLRVLNLEGKTVLEIQDRDNPFNLAAMDHDGNTLLTAGWSGLARLWNPGGQPMGEFKAHDDNITSVSFSENGPRILTSSADGGARLWDLKGNLLAELDKHTARINHAQLSSDGLRVLTASSDNTATLWKLDDQPVIGLDCGGLAVDECIFSPDGKRILAICGNQLLLFDRDGFHPVRLQGHEKRINMAVFSPEGDRLLTCGADNTARLWNTNGRALKVFRDHSDNVSSARFSPNAKFILTASHDHGARLFDIESGAVMHTFFHNAAVNSAVFSPDGKSILTCGHDNKAKLWNLKGDLLHEFTAHQHPVRLSKFSPDGSKILTFAAMPLLWHKDGSLAAQFQLEPEDWSGKGLMAGGFSLADFSPNGSKIITVHGGGTIMLWDLKGNQVNSFLCHDAMIESVAFSPNSLRIVTGAADGTAKLTNLDGTLLSVYESNGGVVKNVAFSPDNGKILTVSEKNGALLWMTPETIVQWLSRNRVGLLP